MKVLVLGANGQLGKALKKESFNYHYKILFFGKDRLDITDFSDVSKKIRKIKPEIIINCAAYTDVNKSEYENQTANLINNISVGNLAAICKKNKIKLIHISTDYVFDGQKSEPYKESDIVNPLNYYGLTKVKGEKQITDLNLKNSIIIRTSWLYSDTDNNFVSKILKKIYKNEDLCIVEEEYGSPTNADDLAKFILYILPVIENNTTQTFHYCNDGICSRKEFVQEILNNLKPDLKINSIKKFDNHLKRPKYSALNNQKAKSHFDIEILNWKNSLNNHIKNILINES